MIAECWVVAVFVAVIFFAGGFVVGSYAAAIVIESDKGDLGWSARGSQIGC